MKLSTLALSALAGSAAAFSPSALPQSRVSDVGLNAAERSKSLPFMNRPALVSEHAYIVYNRALQRIS